MPDEPDYLSLQAHYERKLREHGDNHRGVNWPNKADAARRYDVMLDLIGDPATPASLLDIGCGLAHFYERIVEKQWDRSLSPSKSIADVYTARATTIRLPPTGHLIPASVRRTSARRIAMNRALMWRFSRNSRSTSSSCPPSSLLVSRLAAIRGNSKAVKEDENIISKPLRTSFVSSSPRR
jgi:hypothetical protein